MTSRSPVERLRAFADENGLSQHELAELIGCRQPSVSRIFSGTKGVGFRLAVAIEHATDGLINASEWIAQPEHEAVR